MSSILISGGSGLIGRALTKRLIGDGHTVRWLSRSPGVSDGVQRHAWDIGAGRVDLDAFDSVDHIVHLSGAGIADGRWTDARKKELYASRGGAARLLLQAVRGNGFRPKSFISASGVGYYGAITTDRYFTEADPPGTDTIGRLSQDWEAAADEWSPICRVVKVRTPMVLARDGGALKRMSVPFRLGLGAALGSGRQWMPWIHLADLVAFYQRAIVDESFSGAYNVATSEQPMNRDFMRALARALHRPFFLPNVPAFALRLAFGEMSSILLEGSRVATDRSRALGFTPAFASLDVALKDAVG